MARNFVGKVTRHSEKAGVTLRARVTTPAKNITVYKDFKCMVKATGLTDEQAVITDLNTITNNLLNKGITGINSNLTTFMPHTGINETNVSYVIEGDNIDTYFTSDGIVITRPKFGSAAIVGSMTIKVDKNEAHAERTVTISIAPYTAGEVVDSLVELLTWDTIKGANYAENSSDENLHGPSNVYANLNLISTITSELIETPIAVQWSIESDTISNLFTDIDGNVVPRINVETGTVVMPKYSDVYEAKKLGTYGPSITYCTFNNKQYARLSGIVLKATFNLNDVDYTGLGNVVKFNLKTLSAPLTNLEMANYLKDNVSKLRIKDTTYPVNDIVKPNASINNAGTVNIDTSTDATNASNLRLFSINDLQNNTALYNFTDFLGSNKIKITSLNWNIVHEDTPGTVVYMADTPCTRNGISIGTDGEKYIKCNPYPNTFSGVNVYNPGEKLILRCTLSFYTGHAYDDALAELTFFYTLNTTDLTPAVSTT